MDKDTFFAALTNEAATPDPKFIADLKAKISQIAAGGPPPGTVNLSTPSLIVAITATAAVLGGLAFGILGSDNSVGPSEPVVTFDETTASNEVLASTDSNDSDKSESNSDGAQPSQNLNTDNDSDPTPVVTPPNTPTDPVIPAPVIPNEDWTVDFWTVMPFDGIKVLPIIPTDTPDLSMTSTDLDFDWGDRKPHENITKNHFVAQATTTKLLEPGKYIMTMSVDDGVRVYVNSTLIYDRWSENTAGIADKLTFEVPAGSELTEIVIEYFELRDSAQLVVDYFKE